MVVQSSQAPATVTPMELANSVTIAPQEPQCKFRHCRQVIEVVPGHRRREYCGDTCRQAEFRAREDDKERARIEAARLAQEAREIEELRQRWVDLSIETLHLLRSLRHRFGKEIAHQVGTTIVMERARSQATMEQERTQLRIATGNLERTTKYAEGLVGSYARLQKRIAELEHQLAEGGTIVSDRDTLEARFLALGEAVQYRRLISVHFHVPPGPEAWRAFLNQGRKLHYESAALLRRVTSTAEQEHTQSLSIQSLSIDRSVMMQPENLNRVQILLNGRTRGLLKRIVLSRPRVLFCVVELVAAS